MSWFEQLWHAVLHGPSFRSPQRRGGGSLAFTRVTCVCGQEWVDKVRPADRENELK